MQSVKEMIQILQGRLADMAGGNAVVAQTLSVGDCHVVPLVEVAVGIGGGMGRGEAGGGSSGQGSGTGAGMGGGVSATPVALIVVDNGEVRLEHLGT